MALSRNGCVMDSELCRLISRNWLFPNPFNAKDADGKPFDMFYEDKVKRFKEEGIEYTIRQIDEYRALGVDGIHLYALNKWKDVSEIIDRSGLRTIYLVINKLNMNSGTVRRCQNKKQYNCIVFLQAPPLYAGRIRFLFMKSGGARFMAHVIAVAGKGGVGKTTLCGMLIQYLCEKEKKDLYWL